MVSAAHPADDASVSSAASPTPSASSAAAPRGGGSRGRKGVPKPKSDKRVAANRLNARKSTGPRTAAGRAASRFNALRHGLCARVVLLPGEDRREYEAFAEHFADDLKPRGVMQELLAGRAAAIAWALRRLPDAATDLAERGENRRFQRWFHNRGLRNKYDVAFSLEERGAEALPTGRAAWAKRADAELADAAAEGDPAPADRAPAGIVADALAGDDAFAAILKLEEHERRLWSALLSVLRALERRQKLDGRAEGDDAGNADGDGTGTIEEAADNPEPAEAELGLAHADHPGSAAAAAAADASDTINAATEVEPVVATAEAGAAPEAAGMPRPTQTTATAPVTNRIEATGRATGMDAPARNEANALGPEHGS